MGSTHFKCSIGDETVYVAVSGLNDFFQASGESAINYSDEDGNQAICLKKDLVIICIVDN